MTHTVTLRDAAGREITLPANGSTDHRAESDALRHAEREYPGRKWHPVLTLPRN